MKTKLLSFLLIIIILLPTGEAFAQVFNEASDHLNKNTEEIKEEEASPMPQPFSVNAKGAVLMEAESREIIMAQNPHEKLAPASITKIMTLYLIYEAIEDGRIKWDDVVTVSEHAAGMGGSQVFLEPNEQQTVLDLTKCIAVASANDASVAMAEFISGNEGAFVTAMNKKAQEIGMKDTNFVNSCGLDDPNHYSSAYDIAVISRELITKYPEVLELTQIWMDKITHRTKRGEEIFELANTNKLLKSYPGAIGLKTGFTGKALFCLSAVADKDGLVLISVVLGAPDYKTRLQETVHLLDYGYANFGLIICEKAGSEVARVKVDKGLKNTVGGVVLKDVSVMTPKGKEPNITHKVEILPSITAPLKKGNKLGEITFHVNGKEMAREDIVAVEDVEKIDFTTMVSKLLSIWVGKINLDKIKS